MKYTKKIKLFMILAVTFLVLTGTNVYAQETEEAENVSEQSATNDLRISIEYPEQISCGTPVTFTVNASGGSGKYKYRLADLATIENGEWVSVYDVSYGSNGNYKESNQFTFTFYASGTYYIRFSIIDMTTYQTKMTGLKEYPINIQDANYPSVEQIVDNVAAQCEKECSTDFEKALWLHDWIIDHADYDHSYSYTSAEGVLARGKGTCESYHRAYVMLLNKIGIETGRITGNQHVWTAVKLDGDWYQIDSTWDDMGADYKGTYYEHMYFGLTDYIIGLVHSDHTGPVAGYESDSLEDNYFIKTGEIKQWSDPFIDTIRQNISNGNTDFTIAVQSGMPDNYKNVIYNLVAYQLSKENWENVELSVSYANDQLSCKVTKKDTENDNDVKGQTIYQGVDYSPVYNFNYYISKYGDIKAAFGNDSEKVLAHFVENGMREGRQASEEFNVEIYRNRYSDLRNAYGNNTKQYYMHYITYGKSEGRSGAGTAEPEATTVYQGVDYSPVYNFNYYISKYGDIKAAFGNDSEKVLAHFVENGMREGRQASEEFNVETYRNRYSDLRNAYGNNTKQYYMHYITYGKSEGRSGAGTAEPEATTVYQGVDYSPVYNFNYYISKYGDIKAAFGNDSEKVLAHFVENGMREERQASEEFNVEIYKNRYSDLRNAYGNNTKQYYMHYITYGKSEGRSGRK